MLILLHLLNVVGYYGIFFGLKVLNDSRVNADLDRNMYAGSEAMTLRIPFSLPYSSNQENYERIDGKFEYEGRIYRIVKQKLYNDTLYVVCVNDQMGKILEDSFVELAQSITGTSTDTKPSGKPVILLMKDFEKCEKLGVNITQNAIDIEDKRPSYIDFPYSNSFIYSIDPPPQG